VALARSGGKALIVVGRDSRVSGPMFQPVVHAALQSVGCDRARFGMFRPRRYSLPSSITTPTRLGHHPQATTLSSGMRSSSSVRLDSFWTARKGRDATSRRGKHPTATWDKLGTITQDRDAAREHIEKILALPLLDVEGIRKKGFRVALDCVRGAAAYSCGASRAAGMQARDDQHGARWPLSQVTGAGSREPRRAPELVLDSHCDIGMAVDPTLTDWHSFSDEGIAIGEDYTLALAAKVVLRHRKGVIVTNLSTSRIVDGQSPVKRNQGDPRPCRRGECGDQNESERRRSR